MAIRTWRMVIPTWPAVAINPLPVEWPYRRAVWYALPPVLSREAFYAAFDADGDMVI